MKRSDRQRYDCRIAEPDAQRTTRRDIVYGGGTIGLFTLYVLLPETWWLRLMGAFGCALGGFVVAAAAVTSRLESEAQEAAVAEELAGAQRERLLERLDRVGRQYEGVYKLATGAAAILGVVVAVIAALLK